MDGTSFFKIRDYINQRSKVKDQPLPEPRREQRVQQRIRCRTGDRERVEEEHGRVRRLEAYLENGPGKLIFDL